MTTARCTFSTAATETISGEKSCWRYTYNKRTLITGFWNRIHFFRIRMLLFFSLRIRIHLWNFFVKITFKEFSEVEKDRKDCLKAKKHEAGQNLILNYYWYGTAPVPISLHFSCFFLRFYLLDPDPGEKMNADPCESGSTALQRPKELSPKW